VRGTGGGALGMESINVRNRRNMSEQTYTSSDLFVLNLKNFAVIVNIHIREAIQNGQTDWGWYDREFPGFLSELQRLSTQSTESRLQVYTRANYVKFCRMMAHIHDKHQDIIPEIPQWSFLATELHCRVIEREIVEAVHPFDHQEVNAHLNRMLCRMQQGI